MIEATDEDCDESDLPSQISPTTSDIAEASYHTNNATSNKNLSNSIGNQPNISEAKHESLSCGSGGILSVSQSIMKQHNESYNNPVVSLVSLNGEASRLSTSNTEQPNLEAGQRGRRRISDIKGETPIK